jgi:acetate kinase
MAPADLRRMLYERSGLLGVSGISSEMRALLDSDEEDAARAVEFFVYRCQREIGSLAAALGGIDALVLTGGMGEHAPEIRRRICEGLGWLGVGFDAEANLNGSRDLSAGDGRVATLTIPTDEEIVLARHAEGLLRSEDADTG